MQWKTCKIHNGIISNGKQHHRQVIWAYLSSLKGKIACEPVELVGFERKQNNIVFFSSALLEKVILSADYDSPVDTDDDGPGADKDDKGNCLLLQFCNHLIQNNI